MDVSLCTAINGLVVQCMYVCLDGQCSLYPAVPLLVLLLLLLLLLLVGCIGCPSRPNRGVLGATYALSSKPVRSGAIKERRVNLEGSNVKRPDTQYT